MSIQPQQGCFGQAIGYAAYQSVERFRYRHGCLLIGLAATFIGVLVCRDIWAGFPRWPVYFLAVALVSDAMLHAAINRSYQNEQVQGWKEVLALAATVEAKAGSEAWKPPQPAPVKKPVPKAGSNLRLFQPDGEPKQVQS